MLAGWKKEIDYDCYRVSNYDKVHQLFESIDIIKKRIKEHSYQIDEPKKIR